MANAKKYLKNGVFGEDENGDLFIVSGDYLCYQDGLQDYVSDVDDNLTLCSGREIEALYNATCFNQVKRGDCEVIWKREEKTEETPKDKSITITMEQFFNIADKVNCKFIQIGGEVGKSKDIPGADMANLIMGLQNIAFASLLADELFGESQDKA